MADVYRLCEICGKIAKHKCRLCGKTVCDDHFDSKHKICVTHSSGRKIQ